MKWRETPEKDTPEKRSLEVELFIWVALTVLLALMPLLLNLLWGRLRSTPLSFANLLKRGELFLVGTTLTAEALGRIFNISHHKYTGRRILWCRVRLPPVLGFGGFAMLMTRLEPTESGAQVRYDIGLVVLDSTLMFGLAVAIAISAIILGED